MLRHWYPEANPVCLARDGPPTSAASSLLVRSAIAARFTVREMSQSNSPGISYNCFVTKPSFGNCRLASGARRSSGHTAQIKLIRQFGRRIATGIPGIPPPGAKVAGKQHLQFTQNPHPRTSARKEKGVRRGPCAPLRGTPDRTVQFFGLSLAGRAENATKAWNSRQNVSRETSSGYSRRKSPSQSNPPFSQGTATLRHSYFEISPVFSPRDRPPNTAACFGSGPERIAARFTARDISQSNSPANCSNCFVATPIFDSCRLASRRKTLFRTSLSIKVIRQFGRRIATGIPGNPPPEPKSQAKSASAGKWEARKRDSPACLRTASSKFRTEVRLIRAFQRNNNSM